MDLFHVRIYGFEGDMESVIMSINELCAYTPSNPCCEGVVMMVRLKNQPMSSRMCTCV